MATPFLTAFSEAVLASLGRDGLIELAAGTEPAVVGFVAERLSSARSGESLVAMLSLALIEAPGVEELFADDEQLKEIVTDLPREMLPVGGAR
jgi:hypothetical protein